MNRRTFLARTGAATAAALATGTLPAFAQTRAEVLMAGRLSGRSDHVTTGTVSVQRVGGKTYAVLGADFSLDGAPDPTLGFGRNGFVKATEFAQLRDLTGEQIYELPAGLDPADYTEFYVWCREFSVPLGVAELRPR
ncbi:MAG: DM13 domain-containing protein [Pseudomonadota bacterium]